MNRFERLVKNHLENIEKHGHSPWMAIRHTQGPDDKLKISVLKNPATGEVVSDEGWED